MEEKVYTTIKIDSDLVEEMADAADVSYSEAEKKITEFVIPELEDSLMRIWEEAQDALEMEVQ